MMFRKLHPLNPEAFKLLLLLFLIVPFLASAQDKPSGESREFRHPAGLLFSYPASWTAIQSSFADVELVPPDQRLSPQGPSEAYFIWGLGLEPSRDPGPQIETHLEELMSEIASFLKKSGDPDSFIGKETQGFIYTWQGKRSDDVEIRSRMFVLPEKEIAFVLVALGVKDEILKRETILNAIFASFRRTGGDPDRSLVGFWKSFEDETSENNNEGSIQESSEMEFYSDGSFKVKNSESASQTQEGNAGESNSSGTTTGKWFSLDNRLYFISPGQLGLTFRFEINGESASRSLTLLHPNGSRQLLREITSGLHRE